VKKSYAHSAQGKFIVVNKKIFRDFQIQNICCQGGRGRRMKSFPCGFALKAFFSIVILHFVYRIFKSNLTHDFAKCRYGKIFIFTVELWTGKPKLSNLTN
jgi:hypothetical protein